MPEGEVVLEGEVQRGNQVVLRVTSTPNSRHANLVVVVKGSGMEATVRSDFPMPGVEWRFALDPRQLAILVTAALGNEVLNAIVGQK